MLSKNDVPTPTGAPDAIMVEVAPEPTAVSKILIGSPFANPVNAPDSFCKKNLIVELLRTDIPVIIPEKPAEPLNPVMVSDGVTGTAAITLGAEELVYPRPGLVIVILVIIPAVIDAVAVAVSPVPTVPSPFMKVVIPVVGIPTEIDVVAPTYPLPPSVTVID